MFDFVKKYIAARNSCDNDYDDYNDYDEVYGECKECHRGEVVVDSDGHVFCDNCNTVWDSVEDYENDEEAGYNYDYATTTLYKFMGRVYTEDEYDRLDPDWVDDYHEVHPLCDCGEYIVDDGEGHYRCSSYTCRKKYSIRKCKYLVNIGQFEYH